MKRVLDFLTLVIFAVSLFAAFCISTSRGEEYAGVFYVAVDGDDSNTGAVDAPFATLERARDAIREIRAENQDALYCVRIGEGDFSRHAPFALTKEDSRAHYIGVPDKTIITAGRDLAGWSFATPEQKENFPNSDAEIWTTELPDVDGIPFFFEQLFVNETRAVRSRYPNDGFLRPESIGEEIPENAKSARQEIIAKSGDLDPLKLTDIPASELRFAQFVVHHHWDTTRRILLGYDSERRALKAQGSPMRKHNPWRDTSMYYLENVRTAFDEPGEWFYAGDEGRVYYRPKEGETIDSTRFVAPVSGVNRLLVVSGSDDEKARDIRFENIRFVYADAPRRESTMRESELDASVTGDLSKPGPSQFEPMQAAFFAASVITVEDAERVVFERCEVAHVGEYGIWFKNCVDCAAIRTNFVDLGGGGIRIGGGKLDARNKIENCLVTRGGRFFASAVGVWIGQNTEDIEVLHNDINDFYYTGVSVGWVWGYNGGRAFRNRIEFNRIWKIGQGHLSDMGGVYTLGTSTGTRVCNNVLFDVSSYAYGGWGLYPDEGSEGILFENNLVYDTTDGSFHQHYGKDNIVRNNILARSKTNPARAGEPPHQLAITRVEDHLSDTFERNIIYWKEGVALGYNADRAKAIYTKNLWFNAGGEATFSGKTHDEWTAETGKDADGIVADPMFVDPDANDFRLKPGSPAEKIGFVPFDYTKAGIEP